MLIHLQLSMAAFPLQWQRSIVTRETVRPQKPTVIAIYCFS